MVDGDTSGEITAYITSLEKLLISHMFSDEMDHPPEVFVSIYYRGN